MNTSRIVISNTAYQIVGKVVSMTITMLATYLITRAYGTMGYGEFSLMQNWPALFFVIVDFGVNAIAVRELSKDWSSAQKYFSTVLFFRTVFSVIVIAVVALGVAFFPYSPWLKFGIFLSLFSILTQGLYATANIFFQVKHRYDFSTISYLLGYVLILILVLVFSYTQTDIVWVNFAYVLGGIVTFVAQALFLRKHNLKLSFAYDPTLLKYLLTSSLPLGLMFIFSQINFKSDTILLSVLDISNAGKHNNTEAVALYGLSYKIFEVALVVPTFFMNSVYPILVRKMLEGKDALKINFSKVILFLLASGLLCGLAGVVFSRFAIIVLGGPDFVGSILVLQILMSGLVLYYLTQPIAWLIVTLGRQNFLPLIYLISAVLNVVLNFIFIPKYSIYASAVITHVSEVVILVLLIIFARKAWKENYD